MKEIITVSQMKGSCRPLRELAISFSKWTRDICPDKKWDKLPEPCIVFLSTLPRMSCLLFRPADVFVHHISVNVFLRIGFHVRISQF